MGASRSARYRWRGEVETSHSVAEAEAFGYVVECLKDENGDFSEAEVVSLARSPESSIHGMFEWNDGIAAEKYRCVQARQYIHALVVLGSSRKAAPIPATVSFRAPKHRTGDFREMTSTQFRSQMLMQALAEARAWVNRYQSLEELAEVFAAIVKAEERMKRSLRPTAQSGAAGKARLGLA